jgi:ubiquinone/menaquinone biosynthesis C-methylase UbiE
VIERILEPEIMDTWEDAVEYDSMDFSEVNAAFAQRAVELGPPSGLILDAGTGTARIPIRMLLLNPNLYIIGIDASENMIKLGESNVFEADVSAKIFLRCQDVKSIPYPDNHFDMVISNSLIHHLPDPLPFLKEVNRILKPNAGLLIRDLIRPRTKQELEYLVKKYASDCNNRQRRLFEDSLKASLTLEEVTAVLTKSGIHGAGILQSSDRHWSIERKWYKEMKKDFSLPQEHYDETA